MRDAASIRRVQPVCLRSWKRQSTPARALACSHASFHVPIGLVDQPRVRGPPGHTFLTEKNKKRFNFLSGNFVTQSLSVSNANWLRGTVLPSPASVLLSPTMTTFRPKSTLRHWSKRISEYRKQPCSARTYATSSDRDLLRWHSRSSAASSSCVIARPILRAFFNLIFFLMLRHVASRSWWRRIPRMVPISRL